MYVLIVVVVCSALQSALSALRAKVLASGGAAAIKAMEQVCALQASGVCFEPGSCVRV